MTKFEEAFSRGDIVRRINKLERAVRLLAGGRDLEAASIGPGGLSIKGGFVRWLDEQGNETARFATEGLTLQGLLEVIGNVQVAGGKIEILDDAGDVQMTLATDGMTLQGLLQVVGSIVADGGALIVTDGAGTELFRADDTGVTMTGTLTVTGDSVLSGNVDLTGTLSVQGDVEVAATGEMRAANFDGDLATDDPGTQGWALGDDKAAFAELLLRDGIIGDDKLSNLVRTTTDGTTADRTSVTSTETIQVTLTPPSWATAVSVMAIGSVFLAGLSPPDTPSFECYVFIEGSEGIHNAATVHDELNATATAHHQRTMDIASEVSGDVGVTLRADVNQSGNATGIRLMLSVIAVWSR